MRTAIVSDLHLGSASRIDLLRDLPTRRLLLEEVAGADRLILLGDVLELLDLPLSKALAASEPLFRELGEAMVGRRVVLVPGNHDYRLAKPLLEQLAINEQGLGLEHRSPPVDEPARLIAAWLGDSKLEIAYPGIWLREDVYATHGHYMDCHRKLPRLECLAVAATMRVLGPLPRQPGPAHYERMMRPFYRFAFALAQAGLGSWATGQVARIWRGAVANDGSDSRVLRGVVRPAIAAGLWTANRALGADFRADFSPAAISRTGIDAATELARCLRLEAEHLIVGHTHWDGPGLDETEWRLPSGGYLHNTGSWVFPAAFDDPELPRGPYWPGTVTWLDGDGPPERRQLLAQSSLHELRAAVSRISSTPS